MGLIAELSLEKKISPTSRSTSPKLTATLRMPRKPRKHLCSCVIESSHETPISANGVNPEGRYSLEALYIRRRSSSAPDALDSFRLASSTSISASSYLPSRTNASERVMASCIVS